MWKNQIVTHFLTNSAAVKVRHGTHYTSLPDALCFYILMSKRFTAIVECNSVLYKKLPINSEDYTYPTATQLLCLQDFQIHLIRGQAFQGALVCDWHLCPICESSMGKLHLHPSWSGWDFLRAVLKSDAHLLSFPICPPFPFRCKHWQTWMIYEGFPSVLLLSFLSFYR